MTPSRPFVPLALSLAVLSGAAPALAQIDFNGIPYEKLATRHETESTMISRLQNRPLVKWGEWQILSAFPGDEQGTLGTSLPPEVELTKMTPGGPGPDLSATYEGKNGSTAAWRAYGMAEDRAMELRIHDDDRLNVRATCYLYRTVTVDRDSELAVTMGSDDGLKFWLNGQLLVDADVPRGLNAEEHRLTLRFKQGVNHIFAKVTQGGGGWNYQVNTSVPLDPSLDARLQHQLNKDFPAPEDEYYPVATIPAPPGAVIEVGGMDVTPDGRVWVCTRRGDVYAISGVDSELPFSPTFTLFAGGLHEPLGLVVRREQVKGAALEAVYCVQRAELTRLVDTDGDGRADLYDTFCDDWGVSGNYHEFAFGPKFDADGNAWVTLNVGFCGSLGKSVAPWRGWAVKVTPDRRLIPVCDGLRSPNGIGFWHDGAAFYLDNQGDYVGTNRMSLMAPGLWAGHPSSLHWRDGRQEGDPEPPRQPATIWFPYKKMGQSAADFALDTTNGKFGPFAGQVFVGDQFLASVMRVTLEKIDTPDGPVYQGACYPFRVGLDSGVNRIAFAPDGAMFVGQTDRGWGSVGRRRFGVQRIAWSGKTPFEVLEMKAAPDGFVLTFTADLDPAAAADPASYRMTSYTYEYHATYGSSEMETRPVAITAVEPLDARTVRLRTEPLRAGRGPEGKGEGYVHELRMPGLKDAGGRSPLHGVAYYTLQVIPKG